MYSVSKGGSTVSYGYDEDLIVDWRMVEVEGDFMYLRLIISSWAMTSMSPAGSTKLTDFKHSMAGIQDW